MITLEDIYSGIQSIQSSLDEIQKKSHSLNQSSILGIDDDLIERLNFEISRLQIEDELIPGTFDEEIALNKATYYFEKQAQITNKRAYLTKILAQIPRHRPRSLVEDPRPEKKAELSDAEIDELLEKFEQVTDEHIKEIVFHNQRIMWLVHGQERARYSATQKVILTKKAIEMGFIE